MGFEKESPRTGKQARGAGPGIARVRDYLRQWNLEGRVMEFEVSSATVEEAALAVGCSPQCIAKTLSFLVEDQAVLVVMAGDAMIDNRKFKAVFRQKAVMLKPCQVETLVGYTVGGVCPFALPPGVSVYLDESLRRFGRVYPSAGTAASAVDLTPEELWLAAAAKRWVDVGKVK
ncbi:MAG: YbaK/EbsC family protein [Clostridia bacterium]|nr:YbaK/EbsC family protein [Clostridia bacterium]